MRAALSVIIASIMGIVGYAVAHGLTEDVILPTIVGFIFFGISYAFLENKSEKAGKEEQSK